MKRISVICRIGPAAQVAYIRVPFIASTPPPGGQKHTSPWGVPASSLSRRLCRRFSVQVCYLQAFPRHNGIGSLPSATNTTCSARMVGPPVWEGFFGTAQYIAANANAAIRTSPVVFMGEVLLDANFARPAKYMPGALIGSLWKTTKFDSALKITAIDRDHGFRIVPDPVATTRPCTRVSCSRRLQAVTVGGSRGAKRQSSNLLPNSRNVQL